MEDLRIQNEQSNITKQKFIAHVRKSDGSDYLTDTAR